MAGYSVERYHDFSAGHRVAGHESKCRYLHGHNYRVYFTVEPAGGLDNVGRVLDFSSIKTTLCEWLEDNWDHKMLLWVNDPMLGNRNITDSAAFMDSLVVVAFNPTAENMAEYLVTVVGPKVLPSEVRLTSCRVEETRKCAATFTL